MSKAPINRLKRLQGSYPPFRPDPGAVAWWTKYYSQTFPLSTVEGKRKAGKAARAFVASCAKRGLNPTYAQMVMDANEAERGGKTT